MKLLFLSGGEVKGRVTFLWRVEGMKYPTNAEKKQGGRKEMKACFKQL